MQQTDRRHDKERREKERRQHDRSGPDRRAAHRQPVTFGPGVRPVGVGLGAVIGGSAAAAAAGTAAGGPIGTVAGAVAGAVAGSIVGEEAAQATVDATAEEAYWKEHYRNEPYYQAGLNFDDYAPAYRAGYEGRVRYHGRTFEEAERELETDYYEHRGTRGFPWDKAREAVRAAWRRVGGE
jgi:uncharacterized protein YcfJ